MRYWDHDLGPAAPHLFWAGQLPADDAGAGGRAGRAARPDAGRRPAARAPARTSPSPPTAGCWSRTEDVPDGPAGRRTRLVLTDTASGETRVLVDDPLADVYAAALLPRRRARWSASASRCRPTPSRRTTRCCWSTSPSGAARDLTAGLRPVAERAAVLRRRRGGLLPRRRRRPARRLPGAPSTAERPVRLTADGAYSDLQVARDGSALYALRSAYDSPPRPVRLDPAAPSRSPVAAAQPRHARPRCPARCTRSRRPPPTAPACSRGWCCPRARPPSRPAPLLLWIHGGPLMSWNSLVVALEPVADGRPRVRRPAAQPGAVARASARTSSRRGWGEWGGAPYTDLMAAVDAAEQRPDDRRDAHGGDGRLVRRLHGQLGRHPDRPVPGDRHPRQPLGPRRVHRHDRRGLLLGEGVRRPAARAEALRAELAAPLRRRASARRCWSSTATRTTGCRSARRCGSGTTCRSAACRRSSSTSPTRTTGC